MNEIVSVNIAGWLACAMFLVMLANGALRLADRLKPEPPPEQLRQEMSSQYVSTRLHAETERRIAAMEAAHFEANKTASASRQTMYAKMDGISAELRGEIGRLHQRVDDLSAEVRLVPTTVVRLISESKKI